MNASKRHTTSSTLARVDSMLETTPQAMPVVQPAVRRIPTSVMVNPAATNDEIVREELLRKRPLMFCGRIALALAIIAAASACMLTGNPVLFIIGMVIQGAMYVHLIELQHSVLHLQVFESHRLGRVVGVLLGMPMLISFSDFQYRHLKHHKFLGTSLNTETFNYQHTKLNSPVGFLRAMLDYSRWVSTLRKISQSFLVKQTISDGENAAMEARIRQEHRLLSLVLLGTIMWCAATTNACPLVLWLMPLLVAEPVHFLLELPEHLGLPAHTNPVVFENTRSWGGSLLSRWFTHNTNYHVAHHFNQLVPMHNLPLLQPELESRIPAHGRSASYFQFYLDVISGKITAYDDTNAKPQYSLDLKAPL